MKLCKIIMVAMFSFIIYLMCSINAYQNYASLATYNIMYDGSQVTGLVSDPDKGMYEYHLNINDLTIGQGKWNTLNNICELTQSKNYTWVAVRQLRVGLTGCSNDYQTFLNKFDNYGILTNMMIFNIITLVTLILFDIILIVVHTIKKPLTCSSYVLINILMTFIHLPIYISFGVWYFDFYSREIDFPPGDIKLIDDINTIIIIIIALINNFTYCLFF